MKAKAKRFGTKVEFSKVYYRRQRQISQVYLAKLRKVQTQYEKSKEKAEKVWRKNEKIRQKDQSQSEKELGKNKSKIQEMVQLKIFIKSNSELETFYMYTLPIIPFILNKSLVQTILREFT